VLAQITIDTHQSISGFERDAGGAVTASDVVIRLLRADDFPRADTVWRLAFGTLFGLPDPMSYRGDQNPVRTRFLADPAASFAAAVNDELVGINFALNWGSLGLVGPVAVHPDYWNRGIAQHLMQVVLDTFEQWGTRHVGLFTTPQSPKHVGLYQKFGFWPRFLTFIMAKPVISAASAVAWEAYSTLPATQKQASLEQCRALTDSIYSGLDLSLEIEATHAHEFGETILLWHRDTLLGFAVCHYGPQTEGGSGTCYVKFGAVRPGHDAETTFAGLLDACEALAAQREMTQVMAGINTARREAYRQMLADGFRITVQGLAMDQPDEAAYNHDGVYVIDDWR
jgi:GNAT superfamily N-acetyltransferase